MYIKTKEFNLTEQEFRKLIASHYFKQMRWLIISIIFVIGIDFVLSIMMTGNYLIAIAGLFFLAYFVSIPYIINLEKSQSKLNFKKRYCEIDETFISFVYEDGSLVKLKLEHFAQALKDSNNYLLYTTYGKTQFHYLPIAAFNSEQEISRFDLLLEGKQLLKLW